MLCDFAQAHTSTPSMDNLSVLSVHVHASATALNAVGGQTNMQTGWVEERLLAYSMAMNTDGPLV